MSAKKYGCGSFLQDAVTIAFAHTDNESVSIVRGLPLDQNHTLGEYPNRAYRFLQNAVDKCQARLHRHRCDKSCPKKTVGKEYIEDLVVYKLRDFLAAKNINTIAHEVMTLYGRERNNDELKHLN